MKKIQILLLLLSMILLSGCLTSKKNNSKTTDTISSSTQSSNSVILTEGFEVGSYYEIKQEDTSRYSRITFYDEVDRIIEEHEYHVELIKVPEYTHKISLKNLTFRKAEFSDEVYPADKEIKDEEQGGEKPVFVLKEQLLSGVYYIRFRDYLSQVWTLGLYRDNKLVRTYNYSKKDFDYNHYYGGFVLWSDQDFDFARLYNCSLVYYSEN